MLAVCQAAGANPDQTPLAKYSTAESTAAVAQPRLLARYNRPQWQPVSRKLLSYKVTLPFPADLYTDRQMTDHHEDASLYDERGSPACYPANPKIHSYQYQYRDTVDDYYYDNHDPQESADIGIRDEAPVQDYREDEAASSHLNNVELPAWQNRSPNAVSTAGGREQRASCQELGCHIDGGQVAIYRARTCCPGGH